MAETNIWQGLIVDQRFIFCLALGARHCLFLLVNKLVGSIHSVDKFQSIFFHDQKNNETENQSYTFWNNETEVVDDKSAW